MKQWWRLFVIVILLCISQLGYAATRLYFWHSMAGSLGVTLQNIVDEFNDSQSEYKVVPIYKGNYSTSLTSLVAAFRAHKQPVIAQVFEAGTAIMVTPAGATVPLHELMARYHIPFDEDEFLPAIRYYYADKSGQLMAMPFNSSSAVMYYNKTAFKKAGLDPNKPLRTWPEVEQASRKLLAAGYECGFTVAWPSWTLLESFSAWHNLPYATADNGFSSNDVRLKLDNPELRMHLQKLAEWQQQGVFRYGGREDDPMSLFNSEQCAMAMTSSGSRANIQASNSFPVTVAPMPYWPDIKGAPQNGLLGGAALWTMTGHSDKEYKGAALFYQFLMQPKIQAQWEMKTGYVPVTKAAYEYSKQKGFYRQHPGAEVAINELSARQPTNNSRGIRLGYYPQIRMELEDEMEAVFAGEKTPAEALRSGQERGDRLLRRFKRNVN